MLWAGEPYDRKLSRTVRRAVWEIITKIKKPLLTLSYFYTKDLGAALALSVLAAYLVSFDPELLGHPDNNIPANPYSTPAHIVPEWYFLWVYAILRSIPNKLAGVAAIGAVFVA